MNCKTSLNQRLFRHMAIAVGFVGIAAATPVLAQQFSHETRLLQMAQASPSIQGSWRLANMSEAPTPTPMVPSEELTADFSGDRLSGSGGCNRFMGGFKTQNNQLTVEPLASTFKACETPIMNQEAKYLAALQGAQRYEVNDQGLQIFYQTAQGSGVLRFTSNSGGSPGGNPGGNPGNSTRPVPQTNFEGRGVAQGAAFTQGRTANVFLTTDRDNFVLELVEPGGRARVQYRGAITRRRGGESTNSGTFTLDGRVRSTTSSDNLRVLNNATGTCRVQVFDSRVNSVRCNTLPDDNSTQFLGLEQF